MLGRDTVTWLGDRIHPAGFIFPGEELDVCSIKARLIAGHPDLSRKFWVHILAPDFHRDFKFEAIAPNTEELDKLEDRNAKMDGRCSRKTAAIDSPMETLGAINWPANTQR